MPFGRRSRFSRTRRRIGRRRTSFRRRRRGVFASGPAQGSIQRIRTSWSHPNETTTWPFPNIQFNKMGFTFSFAHTATAVMVLTELTPNNIFFVNAAGKDAYGAAELIRIYENWVVVGCSYVVEFINLSTSIAWKCIVWPSAMDQDPIATTDQIEQQPGARTKMLPPLGSGNKAVFRDYLNINKMVGTQVTSESEFWGNLTNGPSNPFTSRLYIGTMNMTNASTAAALNISVRFTFYVKWFKPLIQTTITDDLRALALERGAAVGVERNLKQNYGCGVCVEE